MTYTGIQFRKIATFFYVLIFLLLFNLYFNLNYHWFGVSLIVRVYLYVFSFYLVYVFSMNNRSLVDSLRVLYIHKYGERGEFFLQLENKFVPFAIITAVTVAYTFIDYIAEGRGLWTGIIKLISGRYSNVLIYSLFLYFIINIRRRPRLAVSVFVVMSFFYFFGDKMVYQYFPFGPGTSAYRIIKSSAFFFIILYDFSENTKSVIRTAAFSLLCSAVLYGMIVGGYYCMYYAAGGNYYVNKESGLALAKLGYPVALRDLQKRMIIQKDSSFLDQVFTYGHYYNRPPELSDQEWVSLLFSGRTEKADGVATYLLRMDRRVPYDLMVGYIEECIRRHENVNAAENLISLAARSVSGNEQQFLHRLGSAGKEMTLWGIQVLRETKSSGAVPFLLQYLFDLDERVSHEAYAALSSITGVDPAGMFGLTGNSPETLVFFKVRYAQMKK
jgi:hypothetical protein